MKIVPTMAFALAVALTLTPVSTTQAEPLDPALVPADAKWVIHVDFDALRETALAKTVRQKRPELVEGVRKWIEERYGIDPRQDLHGLTMFSDSYEPHTGSAILLANYDRQKVQADLEEKPNAKKQSLGDQTVYTIQKDENKSGQTLAIILLDGKVVFTSSAERGQNVVQLIQGKADALTGQSDLIADVPAGTVAFGAAIDLEKISAHDRPFPVLKQHQRIQWATGEHQGQAFENLTLVAQSEEVARQMKTALEGMVAFLKVWAADSEELTQLMDDVQISIDGVTVKSQFQAETEEMLEGLEAFMARVGQWKSARR